MNKQIALVLILALASCIPTQKNKMEQTDSKHEKANALKNETSPYLLQHAYNPVNWMPWGEEALNKAKEENKPIIISIGYSACHWCHVMEHESFEDTAVARLMNENFVAIKIDREERPDIDQVYMNAVQLITGRGGWPLNCITTPDGRPFFGGTYFPKVQWIKTLNQLVEVYKMQPDKVNEYADNLTQGIKMSELVERAEISKEYLISDLDQAVASWQDNFDMVDGGNNYAPKFPIPNNYDFLMHYGFVNKNQEVLDHVELTLVKMAYGGIYDQVGGGFSRYSTDMNWKVPHFEKMLYDNAQLISLYTHAYQLNKDPLYKQIVFESIAFVNRELKDKTGAFYSALDADSEGEEGKYYVWTQSELKTVLGNNFGFANAYFNINSRGLWEHGNHILLRNKANLILAEEFNMPQKEFEQEIQAIKIKLLNHREKRIKPGLDDKSLTSWNALMIKALAEASLVFEEELFLTQAIESANFLLNTQKREDGGLFHSYKSGKSTINGFLEDYAFTAEACLKLYEATFDEKWLVEAKNLIDYAIQNFQDSKSGMFFFTDAKDPKLISRKMELSDNVIPASNSVIAHVLFRLGTILDHQEYKVISDQMLSNMKVNMTEHLTSNTNWGKLLLHRSNPFKEVAIVGNDAKAKLIELQKYYFPDVLFLGSKKGSNIPLLENKFVSEQTTIYVCENKACKLPVTDVLKAVEQIFP